MSTGCDGRFVPDEVVDYHDGMQVAHRQFAHLDDRAHRVRLHREDVVLRSLMKVAARMGSEERAVVIPAGDIRGLPEAERIAAEHGFSEDRLIAMRGLARSRGVELEVVLRAALRGELRSIVQLPPSVAPRPEEEER